MTAVRQRRPRSNQASRGFGVARLRRGEREREPLWPTRWGGSGGSNAYSDRQVVPGLIYGQDLDSAESDGGELIRRLRGRVTSDPGQVSRLVSSRVTPSNGESTRTPSSSAGCPVTPVWVSRDVGEVGRDPWAGGVVRPDAIELEQLG